MTTTYDIPELQVIVAGDPIGGFRFYGPYDHSEVDADLISHLIDEEEWWIADVEKIPETHPQPTFAEKVRARLAAEGIDRL